MGLGELPEPTLCFGGLSFTPGTKLRLREGWRKRAHQRGGAPPFGACASVFGICVRAGACINRTRVPDDTGVLLNAGAKFDLALSDGSDACLLGRQ